MHAGFEHISNIFGQYFYIPFDAVILTLHTQTRNRCHRVEEKMRTKL